jgi:hypothetical protein
MPDIGDRDLSGSQISDIDTPLSSIGRTPWRNGGQPNGLRCVDEFQEFASDFDANDAPMGR